MGTLGSLGQLLMFALLSLLIAGSGLAIWSLIRNISKTKQNTNIKINTNNMKNGGFKMSNNGWLKLAVFAFVGIIVSVVVLGMTSSSGLAATGNAHSQHQQAGLDNNMNMQGAMNMNGNMTANGMNMQGMNMNDNSQMMQMQGMNPNGNMQMNNNNNMLQQQMMQMQYQLNMMQQQMNMMNNQNMSNMGNMNNMQQGNMNGNGQMQGGMGMGMMNMMPMNNMQQNSNSGGGMGGMM